MKLGNTRITDQNNNTFSLMNYYQKTNNKNKNNVDNINLSTINDNNVMSMKNSNIFNKNCK